MPSGLSQPPGCPPGVKLRAPSRSVSRGSVGEVGGRDGEVGVSGVLGDGEVGVARVEVDGLSAHLSKGLIIEAPAGP